MKTMVAALVIASTLLSLGACMAPTGGSMPQTGMSGGGSGGGMGGGGGGGY
jgi:hypothetical protein